MKDRIHTPVVTVKLMNPGWWPHFDKWHWTLRWQVDEAPEPPPHPNSTRRRTRLRSTPERMAWASSRRAAQRAAKRAWADELTKLGEKPSFSYAL